MTDIIPQKVRHTFHYVDPARRDLGPKELGEVYSHFDCPYAFSRMLVVDDVVRLEKFPEYDKQECFYISFNGRKDTKLHMKGLVKWLRSCPHKGGHMQLGKKATAIAVPVPVKERGKLGTEEGTDGFLCYIQKHGEYSLPDAAPVTPSSGATSKQDIAASHYDLLKRANKGERKLSQIYHMRQLNNWIKAALIDHSLAGYVHPDKNIRVLDLGCGKGGDKDKWLNARNMLEELVGVDIARQSLNDYKDRVAKMPPNKSIKISRLGCVDMGSVDVTEQDIDVLDLRPGQVAPGWIKGRLLAENELSFDVVSCQFAVHYMFQDLERADFFFRQVNKLLCPGGVFIATTVDCRVMAEMALHAKFGKRFAHPDELPRTLCVRNGEGNTLMQVTFEQDTWEKMVQGSSNRSSSNGGGGGGGDSINRDAFGFEYNFQLYDGTDAPAVDAPEWLVPLGKPLHELARRHSMTVETTTNFHDFVHDVMAHGNTSVRTLMDELNVFDLRGSLSEAEWDIARMYCCLVLRKDGGGSRSRGSGPVKRKAADMRGGDTPPTPDSSMSPTTPEHDPDDEGDCPIQPTTPEDDPDSPFYDPEGAAAGGGGMDYDPEGAAAGGGGMDYDPESSSSAPDFDPEAVEGDDSPALMFAPTTPEEDEPLTPQGVDDDHDVMLLLQARGIAVKEAGGEAQWNMLSESKRKGLLAAAKEML